MPCNTTTRRGKAALTEDPFGDLREQVEAQRHPPRERVRYGFIAFMLVLTAIFVTLGVWQMQRFGEKQALIAQIDSRMGSSSIQLPPATDWARQNPDDWNYVPVVLSGTFRHDQTVLVFTSVDGANGSPDPGYWVMAPLVLDDAAGGVVLVNRGFVPQDLATNFADGGPVANDRVEVTGIARVAEKVTAFTPGPETSDRIEYVRNIDRIATMLPKELTPLAPIYVDMADNGLGDLPRGGLTVVDIPNRHFEYALTWFALALLTPSMLVVWWQYRRRA